jgi:hypothetical protein
VTTLAQEVTAPYVTPYDKATAIESYLRNYPYNTEISAPPEGMDAVEYFLFDVRQGYCDYYASAMAVMLRTIGVPSRLAAGYAPGELVAGDDKPVYTDEYRVLERDAHAWVEVFFPTYGWIQFEPTASQPLVQRVVAVEPSRIDSTPEPPIEEDEDLRDLRNLTAQGSAADSTQAPSHLMRWLANHQPALALFSVIVVLVVIAAFYLRRREEAFLASPELLAGLLGRVGAWAARLRIPWPSSHTPMEHAVRFGREVPEAKPVVDQIATLFVAQRYGRQQPQPETVQRAVTEWARLRAILWKRWLRKVALPRAGHPGVPPTPDERAPLPRDLEPDPQQGTSRRS